MNVDWKHLFFSFSGRLNRKPYWIGSLLLALGSGAAIATIVFGIGSLKNVSDLTSEFFVIPVLGIIAMVLFCSLAISVKRLHDRNKSGWWMTLFYGVGAAQAAAEEAGIAGTGEDLNELGIALSIINLIVAVWFLVELGFLKGTDGDNDYGSNPLTGIPQPKDATF